MAYFTAEGLRQLATSESSGRAGLVHYPTGYTKEGIPSSASGLYGFVDPTWRTYARQAGVDITKYPRAYLAPAEVQTYVAARTPISHWVCEGCNETAIDIANAGHVTANPSGSSAIPEGVPEGASGVAPRPGELDFPVEFGPDGGPGTMQDPRNPGGVIEISKPPEDDGGDYGGGGTRTDQGTDTKSEAGTGTGSPAGSGTGPGLGLAAIGSYVTNWGVRLALILLGVVLIGAAAWGLVGGEARAHPAATARLAGRFI